MESKKTGKRALIDWRNARTMLAVLLVCCGCSQSTPQTASPLIPETPTPTFEKTIPPEVPTATEETEARPQVLEVIIPALVGEAPTLDGRISQGEWEQARVVAFADGSELLLMHANEVLYLAIRASEPGMIAGNVYLLHGDQISILHSSAALGTAIYQQAAEGWEQIQDFSWRCRSTGFSESALAERATFLDTDGWLASNSRMGNSNELEYQIQWGVNFTALAVIFLQGSAPVPLPFPTILADDTVQTFPGGFPEYMRLSTDLWAQISLEEN